MKLSYDQFKTEAKAGRFSNLYVIYGKEPYLVQAAVDTIIDKTVGKDALDFNLQRLEDCPDPDILSDYIESLPVFAERKVITIHDFDMEKADADLSERYLSMFRDIPDTTMLVLYCTGVTIDEKKAKTKKLLAAADKTGCIVTADMLSTAKIAELCMKKAAKGGVVISRDDAQYLTDRVGGQMGVASEETSKLMTYVGKGGEITREAIEKLVPRQLDAYVFDLAGHINAGRRAEAFRLLDELIEMQTEPISIMGAMSGAYLDMYGAKLCRSAGMSAEAAAPVLGFYGNRVYALHSKIFPSVTNLTTEYLRGTVQVLFDTDIAMKSSPVNNRTLLEQAVTKLFMQREKQLRR